LKAVIRGIGVVGGFGTGISTLEKILMDHGPFIESFAVPDGQPLGGEPYVPVDTRNLKERFPPRSLRRMDHLSRTALLAAALALEDAADPGGNADTGVAVASGYGAVRTTFAFLDTILEGGDAGASPTLFSNSVLNAPAAHISMHLGARGPNLTVSRFEMSFSDALSIAVQWLEEGRAPSVLVGGVDEWCPVLGHCRHRFSKTRDAAAFLSPFGTGRGRARIAEGAVFFLLSPEIAPASGYGVVESVESGRLPRDAPAFPKDAVILTGIDHHRDSARHPLPEDRRVLDYTGYYGTLPVGTGFDMAIASVIVRRGRLFSVPDSTGSETVIDGLQAEKAPEIRRVCCVNITPSGAYGLITLASRPDFSKNSRP